MILVATVAELMEGYTLLVSKMVELVFRQVPLPFPRRVRFLVLRNLPFASPYPLPPPLAAVVVGVAAA